MKKIIWEKWKGFMVEQCRVGNQRQTTWIRECRYVNLLKSKTNPIKHLNKCSPNCWFITALDRMFIAYFPHIKKWFTYLWTWNHSPKVHWSNQCSHNLTPPRIPRRHTRQIPITRKLGSLHLYQRRCKEKALLVIKRRSLHNRHCNLPEKYKIIN